MIIILDYLTWPPLRQEIYESLVGPGLLSKIIATTLLASCSESKQIIGFEYDGHCRLIETSYGPLVFVNASLGASARASGLCAVGLGILPLFRYANLTS